jgi:hypothetical protein
MEYGGETKVEVNAKCVEDYEERGICLQEIHIFSGDDHSGEDHGTWSPLLIREIPVYLVWLHTVQPYPNILLESEDQVDRIIVDSRMCDNPLDFYKDLRDHGHWESMAYTDLAWGRIAPLLRSTALLFNPYDLREKLQSIREIRFSGGRRAEVLLFFLWFTSKMGYRLSSEEGAKWIFSREDGHLSAEHDGEQNLEEGFNITFTADLDESFSIKSKEEGYIIQSAPGHESYSSIIKLPKDGEILLGEVDKTGQDRLLAESIQKI